MINELIENVYSKYGKDYIESLAIETRCGNVYKIWINGFEKIAKEELSDHSIDMEYDLRGLTILKVGSDVSSILIELSDRRFIEMDVNGGLFDEGGDNGGLYYQVSPSAEYDDWKLSFEKYMQVLSVDNSFAGIKTNPPASPPDLSWRQRIAHWFASLS